MSKMVSTRLVDLQSDRVAAMLRAATTLFLEHGYARVSIDAIILQTGGSKRDLYQAFGGKEGLFRHVIEHMCDDILTPLKAIKVEGHTIDEALTAFGSTFLRFLLKPNVIALQKLVMSEAGRYPEFAEAFVRSGPTSAYQALECLLQQWADGSLIDLRAPRVTAALFCDMLISDLQFRVLARLNVTDADIEERVATAVSVFLDGVRHKQNC